MSPRKAAGKSPAMIALRQEQDPAFDNSLRPAKFDEFIGQERVKKVLRTAISAAAARQEPLDHILLHGGPGLGKTTLALLVAGELGVRIHTTSGAVLQRGADVLSKLGEVKTREILFIDEIHRLRKPVEEQLYPVLEDFRMDVAVGKGATSRVLRLALEGFTMIGATTQLGSLASPFRNRFGMILRLDPYTPAELELIARASAARLDCRLDDDAAAELSRRARGTPRIVNHLLRRARDWAQAGNLKAVTAEVVGHALEELGVDSGGLDEMDRRLMELLAGRYKGGPVGLKTLADAVSEDPQTIEEFYEPYLIQSGLLLRTTQGRRATPEAMKKYAPKSGRRGGKPPDAPSGI
jgi:Holliday junction DNA helicase RuvB